MLKKIHHSEITVKDLDKSIAFYTEKIGLKLLRISSDKIDTSAGEDIAGLNGAELKEAFLEVGEECLELIEWTNREGEILKPIPWNVGQMHIAFEFSNLEKKYKELKDEGVKFLTPPIHIKSEETEVIWCYLEDPDGALLELVEIK